MALPFPPFIPDWFYSGDTVKFHRGPGGFSPVDGWTYAFTLAGPSVLTVAGVANGAGFDVTLSAAQTAALTQGRYRFIERCSNAGEVAVVGTGAMQVLLNLATAAAGDAQTPDEKLLTVVEAAINKTLPAGMESYSIAGRAVKYYSLKELMELRGQLVARIAQQRGKGAGRTLLAEFGNPKTGGDMASFPPMDLILVGGGN